MNVYDCGNDLAKAIRESHEFKKLKEAKAALDPQGKEMADKFIRLNMEAQIAQSQGKEPEKSITDEIQNAARNYDPAKITRYCIDLATLFHRFYDACSVKNAETEELRNARLLLCIAVRQTLRNVLSILNIDRPEKM